MDWEVCMIDKACILLVVAALGTNCGASPTAPGVGGVADFRGMWTGTLVDDTGAKATMSLDLEQNGPAVSGTFASSSTGGDVAGAGTTSGTASGSTVVIFLTRSVPVVCVSPALMLSGSISATLTLANQRLTGRYTTLTCAGAGGGTIELNR
jgi:hypothetical protein